MPDGFIYSILALGILFYGVGFVFVAFHSARGYMGQFTDAGLLGGVVGGVFGLLVGVATGLIWPVCLLGYVLVKFSTGEEIFPKRHTTHSSGRTPP